MEKHDIDRVVRSALKEDLPQGDITSESIIPPHSRSQAVILAKQDGVLAGLEVAERVFSLVDSSLNFQKVLKDGNRFKNGDIVGRVEGSSISILKGERTALNFLQRLSGIATRTSQFVQKIKGTNTKILDTRKTTPGLRKLEKYAVKVGGGENHRFNLSQMVLIKDNHLKVVGSIGEAVNRAKQKVKPGIKIEVETSNLEEVKEAVESGADIIMLDNIPIECIKQVMEWGKGKAFFEVSGNVALSTIRKIASLGVDYISVGSLTHSCKAVDISLEFIS